MMVTVQISNFPLHYCLFLLLTYDFYTLTKLEREKEYALWQKAIDTTIGVKPKPAGKREP